MYVRWKRRRLKKANSYEPEPCQLTAYLVESQRIDGKPRQRTLAYLGSVRERFLDQPWQRRDFWRTASRKLDELALPANERDGIEARIETIVPRPTEEEIDDARNAAAQNLPRLESVIARRP